MRLRDLTTTLPSPSEHDEHDFCQFSWLMKYRQGVERIESRMGLLVGKALDAALNLHYNSAPVDQAVEKYSARMRLFRKENLDVEEEEWQTWENQGLALTQLYVSTVPRLDSDWAEIVAIQPKLEWPAPMRPDLVLRKADGALAVLEGKMESPFADLDYENLKYELAWQPLLYPIGVSKWMKEPVQEVIMEYRVRGAPAKGKYKVKEPKIVRHSIPVEGWKANMWLASAWKANLEMRDLAAFAVEPDRALNDIPRRTRNCIQKYGHKTFPCSFFLACSVNMHPLEMPDLYHIPKWKQEVKADGTHLQEATGSCRETRET